MISLNEVFNEETSYTVKLDFNCSFAERPSIVFDEEIKSMFSNTSMYKLFDGNSIDSNIHMELLPEEEWDDAYYPEYNLSFKKDLKSKVMKTYIDNGFFDVANYIKTL